MDDGHERRNPHAIVPRRATCSPRLTVFTQHEDEVVEQNLGNRAIGLGRRGARPSEPPAQADHIDSPSVATTRPLAIAASMICWMRWMWLAKLAVITRRRGTHLDGFAMACSG